LLGFASVCPAGGGYAVSTVPSTGNDFGIYCAPGFDYRHIYFVGDLHPGKYLIA